MKILIYSGGLGNQMFQYAFYNYLRKRYPGERVLADISWYTWNTAHQGFELEKLFKREDNPDFVFEKATVFEAWCCSGLLSPDLYFVPFGTDMTEVVQSYAEAEYHEALRYNSRLTISGIYLTDNTAEFLFTRKFRLKK